MRELEIIYEDRDVLVIYKPAGVPVQSARVGAKDCESLLKNYLYRRNATIQDSPKGGAPYLGLIHRLDQPVEGLLVFALNPKAAASLSRQSAGKEMQKTYLAVRYAANTYPQSIHSKENLCGKTVDNVENSVENWVECVDYLWKDGKNNRSTIVKKEHPGAKKAVLQYRILKRTDELEMLEIRLETGRHHQIRVQMAGRGTPLAGDRKYGEVKSDGENVDNSFPALCAYRIRFRHPSTGKWMEFERKPENPIFRDFM